jgi:hypothetical protein
LRLHQAFPVQHVPDMAAVVQDRFVCRWKERAAAFRAGDRVGAR